MLKEFLRDLNRWADDPMTQAVMGSVIGWLAFEALAAHQRKIAAHSRHLRAHGQRLGELERDVEQLLERRHVSRETSPLGPGVMPVGVRA